MSRTGGRGQRTPTQRGSGENKPRRSRILLTNFFGSQEKWKIKTYNRSVQTEFLSGHSVFQNGNGKHASFSSYPEFSFYRDGISDSQELSSSAMGQRSRHSESCTLVQETRTSISKTFPVSSWKIKCSCTICCFGQATLRSSSNGSVRSVETSCYTIRTILINTQIKSHLEWWNCRERFVQGVLLKPPLPSRTLFTDASLSGWGANLKLEGLLFHGVWSLDQSVLHINVSEMTAILLALKQCR